MTILRKLARWAPAILFMLLAAWLYQELVGERDRLQAVESESDARREKIDELQKSIELRGDTIRMRDSAIAEFEAGLSELADSLDAATEVAGSRADSIQAFLRDQALPPAVQDSIDRLVEELDQKFLNEREIRRGLEQDTIQLHEQIRSWRSQALDLEGQNILLRQDAAAWEEEARRRDINLLGIRLDLTCGPGAGVGVGTRGADAQIGVYCVIGR